MPKMPTFRPTFDDVPSFDLADLKRLGCMTGYCITSLNWPRHGSSISLRVSLNRFNVNGFIELEYAYQGEPVCYRIRLVHVMSNLRKYSCVWYFVCPVNGKRCRKLYDGGKYFVSRYALKGQLYESQTHSKAYRFLNTVYGPGLKLNDLRETLKQPYVKSHYKGKLTKRMQKYDSLRWVVEARKEAGFRSVDDLLPFL